MNKATLQYIQLVYFYRLLLIRQLALFNLLSLLAESLQVNETPLEENENAKEPPLEPAVCAEKWRWRRKDTAQEEDPETSLMYYGARYYDPGIGRFISADSVIGADGNMGYNRYMYAAGNPIMNTDPSGHIAFLIPLLIGLAIGAIAGGIMGGTHGQVFSENAWNNFDWKGAGTGALIGAIAGAAGAIVGVAVGAAVGAMAGVSALTASVVGGMAGGATAGFITGSLTTWAAGGSFGDGLANGMVGALFGAVIGAAMGGITYGLAEVFSGSSGSVGEVAQTMTTYGGDYVYTDVITPSSGAVLNDAGTALISGISKEALQRMANLMGVVAGGSSTSVFQIQTMLFAQSFHEDDSIMCDACRYYSPDPRNYPLESGATEDVTLDLFLMLQGGNWARIGKEFSFGRNFRLAPFGNRGVGRMGKPHYHKRVLDTRGNVKPGGSLKRHRPWDQKSTDTNWRDRF
jgi:RHS repeat-associated protein